MPNSFMPNNSKQTISDSNYKKTDVGLPKDSFVYCCFNKTQKITPHVFDIWMNILKGVNKSVLWLLEDNSFSKKNIKIEANKRGVDSKNIHGADYGDSIFKVLGLNAILSGLELDNLHFHDSYY